MVKPLSPDLCARLIGAIANGKSCRVAADRFGVAPSSTVRLVRRWREWSTSAPRPQGGGRRSEPIEAHAREILKLIDTTVAITLAKIAEQRERTHGERLAVCTICALPRQKCSGIIGRCLA